jgi:hypothetical protein
MDGDLNANVNFLAIDWREMCRSRTLEEVLANDPVEREIAAVQALPAPGPVIATTATPSEADTEVADLKREAANLRARLNGQGKGNRNGHG